MAIDTDTLVNREVHYCISYLVSTLANHSYSETGELLELCEQASELFVPIPDYEEAMINAIGIWTKGECLEYLLSLSFEDKETESLSSLRDQCILNAKEDGIEDFCYRNRIEPYYREISSHWIVSKGLAERLEAHGERIDYDFGGMVVWGRVDGGQHISMDSVIEKITNELNAS